MITVHPPPPAPDEGTATQRSNLCEEGDVDGMVVLQATGRRVTLLAKAFASKPIPKYSPIYLSLVGTYSDANMDTATCVPTSYTTPITAAAAMCVHHC